MGRREEKLVCTAGPSAGGEFQLSGEEVLIGRAGQAGIAIPDLTVSRRHVLLHRSSSGWTARDLGSANGTLVNGTRILQPTPLAHGDVLALGDTQLSFRMSQPARLTSPSRRSVLLRRGAALAAFVPALVLAWMKLHANAVSAGRNDEARRGRQRLEVAFQAGKKLVRQGDWGEAQLTFERIRAEAADFPGLDEYIDRAAKEVPNQKLLAGAKVALEQNKLAEAAEALGKVSPDTHLHSQLQAAKDLLNQRVGARVAEAQRAFNDRDYSRAFEVVEDVLKVAPDRSDAESLASRASRALAPRHKPDAAGASRASDAARSRFRGGDLKGAIADAEECAARNVDPCRRLLKQLREFAELHGRMEQLELRDLERLLDLDLRAADGTPSSLALGVMARAAALYYNEASRARSAAQWARAMDLAARALRLAPEHPGALALVGELRARAKELFVFAYSVKDTAPDEAVVRFKEVIALTPPDDQTHRKAVNWVEKLSR